MRLIFLHGQLNIQLKVTPTCLLPMAVSSNFLGSHFSKDLYKIMQNNLLIYSKYINNLLIYSNIF